MDNIINIKELRNRKNKKVKYTAEEICQWGFKGLLGNLYERGFPIMDDDFQTKQSIDSNCISVSTNAQQFTQNKDEFLQHFFLDLFAMPFLG